MSSESRDYGYLSNDQTRLFARVATVAKGKAINRLYNHLTRGGGALCVEMSFTRIFIKILVARSEVKSNVIFIQFWQWYFATKIVLTYYTVKKNVLVIQKF